MMSLCSTSSSGIVFWVDLDVPPSFACLSLSLMSTVSLYLYNVSRKPPAWMTPHRLKLSGLVIDHKETSFRDRISVNQKKRHQNRCTKPSTNQNIPATRFTEGNSCCEIHCRIICKAGTFLNFKISFKTWWHRATWVGKLCTF